jgi:hypothetical protein
MDREEMKVLFTACALMGLLASGKRGEEIAAKAVSLGVDLAERMENGKRDNNLDFTGGHLGVGTGKPLSAG